ncbi:hypothetical protein BS17DRAFT_797611 [Gyrodon lividus]|nr:hypothetical protein BS17DRAFT_797611 [Gyrodon lividus]
MPSLQRKYVDLIHQTSSKWANWDPPIPVEVGAYGTIHPGTGELIVEGNIYDPEFQEELDKVNGKFKIADHPPSEGGIEGDYIIASAGARSINFSLEPQVGFAGIASASLKGQWQFQKRQRDALLVMYKPRQKYIPSKVILDHLYKVPKLQGKCLVTSVHVCPAFSMYLSNKSGEKISLALAAQAPVAAAAAVTAGGDVGFDWWADTQATLLRKACDKNGTYRYTPLYALKRPIPFHKRLFRDKTSPVPDDDEYWCDVLHPWQPLDEDGKEDQINEVSILVQ